MRAPFLRADCNDVSEQTQKSLAVFQTKLALGSIESLFCVSHVLGIYFMNLGNSHVAGESLRHRHNPKAAIAYEVAVAFTRGYGATAPTGVTKIFCHSCRRRHHNSTVKRCSNKYKAALQMQSSSLSVIKVSQNCCCWMPHFNLKMPQNTFSAWPTETVYSAFRNPVGFIGVRWKRREGEGRERGRNRRG